MHTTTQVHLNHPHNSTSFTKTFFFGGLQIGVWFIFCLERWAINSSSVFYFILTYANADKKIVFTSVWEKKKLCFFSISSFNWWCVTSTISKWRDFEIFCWVHVFLIFYATFDRCSKGVWTQVLNHYFRFWHIRFQWLSKFNFFEHFLVITKKDQVLFTKWRATWIMNCFCTFFGTFEANC